MPPRSTSVGATNVPRAHSAGSAISTTRSPAARMRATCAASAARASSSMTGPTSTASRRGSPTASSRIAPSSIASISGATSSCTHRRRSAEHRWPALSNADTSASATTCSESAELSTIIAFWPPVSAISTGSSSRGASSRAMPRATSVEPVKITAATRGSATSAAPTVSPRPGQELQRRDGHARAMQEAHRLVRDQRRLLGGFREHRIAGGERRRDFADEDRQRKIPGRNRHDRANGRDAGRRQFGARLRGVIAQEVGRLAHFGDGVGERLAGLAHGEREKRHALRLEEIGRALETCRTRGGRSVGPCATVLDGGRHRARHIARRGLDHGADDVVAIRGIADGDRRGRRISGR